LSVYTIVYKHLFMCVFFNTTATTAIYTLSLHDALPILILVVWFLLPRVARLMIHTPTAISIFVCLSMVQLMAVFISMRCTLCVRSEERFSRNAETDLVCRLLLEKKNINTYPKYLNQIYT